MATSASDWELDYTKCNPDRQWEIWLEPFPLVKTITIHRDDGWRI